MSSLFSKKIFNKGHNRRGTRNRKGTDLSPSPEFPVFRGQSKIITDPAIGVVLEDFTLTPYIYIISLCQWQKRFSR